MAKLLRVDGTSEVINPPAPGHWPLVDLQTLVGGYIQVVSTTDGRFLVIDEEGKLKRKPLNAEATKLYIYGRHDPIVGVAVLIDTMLEMNGPDEDEDDD